MDISDVDVRLLEQTGPGPTANDELIAKRPHEIQKLIMRRHRLQKAAVAGGQAQVPKHGYFRVSLKLSWSCAHGPAATQMKISDGPMAL